MKREPSEDVVTQRVLYFVCHLECYGETQNSVPDPFRRGSPPLQLDDRVSKVMLFSTN